MTKKRVKAPPSLRGTKQSGNPRRHCEYPFRTETESVMTLVEESAMKQSTTGRHCEER
jgi:hypothetical protein